MDKTQVKEDKEKQDEVTENTAASTGTEQSDNAKEQVDEPQTENNEDSATENEMMKLKEEMAGARDKYIRLYSEFENFRRRTAKEKLEMVQTANEQLIQSLLPVVDDFERAEKAARENAGTDAEGFLLIQQKLRKTLELYGVKAMQVGKGSEFNTDLHEAITQVPAENDLKGKIVDVIEDGYLLNDKVIRFAKVVVGG